MQAIVRFVTLEVGVGLIGAGLLTISFPIAARAAEVDTTKLPPTASRVVDFAKDIQPLFDASCWKCHGPAKQESGLRLDERAGALQGGELFGTNAILPGKSADSVLIQAVAHTHPKLKMPKKGDPLTAAEVGLLRAWIDQGAKMPDALANAEEKKKHWAFSAPVRPDVPKVKASRSVRNPIDHFILARLEKEKLKPSPEADKVTLLRRLSLDLIGLPPTIAEVDAFLADKSKNAYEKQVERLLNSPHYGERWGRHWLDAARYADSDGFEKDKPRFIWGYRDWVIKALNDDMPYDRFIVDQIAGDQLPDPTQDDLAATGFLRNAMLNEEGGVDPEQFRMEGMFDRMDCIGKSVLGLTIQCAQCHNHKFDPLTQQEYYRLFAFLNNDHEASMVAYTPSQQMKVADLTRQIRDLEAGLRHTISDWQERMDQWEDSVKSDQPDWTVVRCVNAGDNGERFYYYDDGSIRAASYAPTKWTAHFRGTNNLPFIDAFQLEQLNDPNLPCNGPGRSIKGMSALSEFKVEAIDLQNSSNKVTVKFVRATADFSNAEKDLEPEFSDKSDKKRVYGPVALAIDGKDDTAWGIDAGPGRRNQPRKAVFIPEKPLTFTNGVELNFRLVQTHGGWNSDDNQNHNLGRFRLSVTSTTNLVADSIPAGVREIFKIPRDQRTPAQIATVFSYWRTTVETLGSTRGARVAVGGPPTASLSSEASTGVDEKNGDAAGRRVEHASGARSPNADIEAQFHEVNDKIEALWKEWPEGTPTLTLMTRKGRDATDHLRATHMLRRGDWLKPGEEVIFGAPAFLHPLPLNADGSRLTFAKWLVDRKSPTTARAFVNRIWQTYFGTGLVETPEDFGTRCEMPSHPELLDWLACEFMEPRAFEVQSSKFNVQRSAPWSIKHIHRLIVTSATYRQSSHVTPELYQRDPYNRLLARGPRFRVEGEIVRDIALAASGLLNPEMGGRSVYPPAPEFLFQPPASYGPKIWKEDTGPERYRRSLYIFKFRSSPYPMLQTFDAPNGDFSCVRRQRSNSPLQALVSLNETEFVECAQALALKTLTEGGKTDGDRVAYAFRRALARSPTADEKNELLALLAKEKIRVAEGWVNPLELATGKNEKPANLPEGATPTQLAAYTVVSRVLLNLDETITKE